MTMYPTGTIETKPGSLIKKSLPDGIYRIVGESTINASDTKMRGITHHVRPIVTGTITVVGHSARLNLEVSDIKDNGPRTPTVSLEKFQEILAALPPEVPICWFTTRVKPDNKTGNLHIRTADGNAPSEDSFSGDFTIDIGSLTEEDWAPFIAEGAHEVARA